MPKVYVAYLEKAVSLGEEPENNFTSRDTLCVRHSCVTALREMQGQAIKEIQAHEADTEWERNTSVSNHPSLIAIWTQYWLDANGKMKTRSEPLCQMFLEEHDLPDE